MSFLLLFFLTLFQTAQPTAPAGLPEMPGVYLLNSDKSWTHVPKAPVINSKLTGTGLFAETGGYTNLGTDVVCEGAKAAVRIRGTRPVFYIRGIGPASDVLLIRLKEKKSTRTFYKSSADSTYENKIGARKSDLRKTAVQEHSIGVFSITPGMDLKPGEYLLVIGEPENSFDFGIDAQK